MSNRFLTQAWNARGLTPTQKIILVRLADRADQNGHCFPGHESLADDCGLSVRTVRDMLWVIQTKGHLTIQEEACRSARGTPRFSYNVHPLTPKAVSGVTGENAALDTGKEALPHGKPTAPTPENGATPIITSKNPKINHQGNQPRPPSISITPTERITLEKELEAISEQRTRLNNRVSHDAWGPMYSKEDRAELKRMKDREAEIKMHVGRVY